MSDIPIPDEIGTVSHEDGDLIWFIHLHQDPMPENPTEWGTMGTFHSLNRKHINFNENCPALLHKNPDSVALSYFEHGNSLWFVANGPTPPGVEFQWDGVRMAGVWEPDQCDIQSAEDNGWAKGTKARIELMEAVAASACEIYSYWCNGQVYAWAIDVYKKRTEGDEVYDEYPDYRHTEAVQIDSCGGYYGREAIQAALKDAIEEMKKTLAGDEG